VRTITKRITYTSRTDVFRFHSFSDIHLGNRHCAEKLLRRDIRTVQDDPFAYWWDLGDQCEFINFRDLRFNPRELAKWLLGWDELEDIAKAQRDRYVRMFQPIGDKCLMMVEGNHNRSILRHTEREMYATIAEGIDAKNVCVGPSGFLRIVFNRETGKKRAQGACWTLIVFATHGWWGGRLMGAGALNLERVAARVHSHIVIVGHDHKNRAFPLEEIESTRYDKVRMKQVWCISSGTYLGSDEGDWGQADYAERAGYRPVGAGGVVIEVTPDKRKIRILH